MSEKVQSDLAAIGIFLMGISAFAFVAFYIWTNA